MAKKNTPLTFRELVLGAEAEMLRQALEARVKIDQLIVERERAYAQIAALETQVEDVLGEAGTYPFPPPPLPVAGIDPKSETVTRGGAPAKKSAAKPTGDDETSSESPAPGPTAATP